MGNKKIDIKALAADFSEEDKKILSLQANGFTSKEIAKKLKNKISDRTIEGRTLRLCKLFGVKTKIQLCKLLIIEGVIQ